MSAQCVLKEVKIAVYVFGKSKQGGMTMTKAEAYAKVREKIALRFGSNVAEEIFSEFEESDDERTRKEMLNVFKQLDECTTICGRNYDYAKWLAWLEKQGKKEPITSDIPDELPRLDYESLQKEFEKQGEQKTDKYEGYCEGCNNVKGCVTCVDGDQWAHYKEVEQKPAWGEEDAKMFNYCCEYLNVEQCTWLKSLRDRLKGE